MAAAASTPLLARTFAGSFAASSGWPAPGSPDTAAPAGSGPFVEAPLAKGSSNMKCSDIGPGLARPGFGSCPGVASRSWQADSQPLEINSRCFIAITLSHRLDVLDLGRKLRMGALTKN